MNWPPPSTNLSAIGWNLVCYVLGHRLSPSRNWAFTQCIQEWAASAIEGEISMIWGKNKSCWNHARSHSRPLIRFWVLEICWAQVKDWQVNSSLRPSVRHFGAGLVSSLHRGREGERAPHGSKSGSDGRRLREAEELAEGCLPQADDRWLQRNERSRGRLPQSSETMGQKTQRGLKRDLVILTRSTSWMSLLYKEGPEWKQQQKNTWGWLLVLPFSSRGYILLSQYCFPSMTTFTTKQPSRFSPNEKTAINISLDASWPLPCHGA